MSTENDSTTAPAKPISVFRRRFRRFRSIRRGWYSFLVILFLYFLTFFAHLLVTERALVVKYGGELHFPSFGNFHEGKEFGNVASAKRSTDNSKKSWRTTTTRAPG